MSSSLVKILRALCGRQGSEQRLRSPNDEAPAGNETVEDMEGAPEGTRRVQRAFDKGAAIGAVTLLSVWAILCSVGRLLARATGRPAGWRYDGDKRDARLDLLRGFAGFAMVVDHVGGDPSWLYTITGGNRFIVSAAEPFVFISGLVMGMVYLNLAVKRGISAALVKALRRARTLYLVAIFLAVGFAAVAVVFNLWWKPDLSNGGAWRFTLEILTFQRTIYLADIMLMYTMLVLMAVPVIFLLSRGYAWLVLIASWGAWTLWQVSPNSVTFPWHIEGGEAFPILAWQVLFVTGLVIGWHREKIEATIRRLSRPALLWPLGLVAATTVGLYILQLTSIDMLHGNSVLSTLAFDKPSVPIGRVLGFALFGGFAFIAATVSWKPMRRALGWLLLPIGENSLTAYSLHLFVVALMTKLTLDFIGHWSSNAVANGTLQVAGVLTVWLIVVSEAKLMHNLKPKLARLSSMSRGRLARRGPYGLGAKLRGY